MDSSGEAKTTSNVQLPSIRNLVDSLPPAGPYRSQPFERPAFPSHPKQESESPRSLTTEQSRARASSKSFNAAPALSLPPAQTTTSRSASGYAGARATSSEHSFTPQYGFRNRALSNRSAYAYRDNANVRADGVAASSSSQTQTRGRWITSDPHSATGESPTSTSGGLVSGEPTLGFSARDRGERRETGQGAQIWSPTPPPSRDYRTDLGVYRRDESTARDPFHPRSAMAIDLSTTQTTLTAQTTLGGAQTPHGPPPPHLPSQPWNHSNLSSHSTGLVPGKHHDFVADRPTSSTLTGHLSHGSHLSQLANLSQLSQLSDRDLRERVVVNPIDDHRTRSSDTQSPTHQSHQPQSHQSHQSHYHRTVSGPGQDYLTPPYSQSDRNSSPQTSTVVPSRRGSRENRDTFQSREDYQSHRDRDGQEPARPSRSSEYSEYPKYSKYPDEPDRRVYSPERDRHVMPSGSMTPNTPKASNRPSEAPTYGGSRDSRDSRNSYNRSMDYHPHSPITPLHSRSERSRERDVERDYVGHAGAGHAGHPGHASQAQAYGRRGSATGVGSGSGPPHNINNERSAFATTMAPPRIPAQSIQYGETSNSINRGVKSTSDLPPIYERRGSGALGTIGMPGSFSGRHSSSSPNGPGGASGPSGHGGPVGHGGASGPGGPGGPSGHAHKYGTDHYNYPSSSEQRRQPHQQFAEPPHVSARSQKKRRTDGSFDSDVVNAAGGLAMLAAGIGTSGGGSGGRHPKQPSHPNHPNHSNHPGYSMHSTPSAHPGHSTYSAHPSYSNHPTHPHSAQSPYPSHPAQSSRAAQSGHPSDAIHPALAGLLRQRSKEDLPRALRELSDEAQRAVIEGRVMKTINEYSRTIARFSEFFVRAKGSVVATHEQCKEMSHRAVLICRMARDLKAKILAKRRMTEEAKQSAVAQPPVIRQAPKKTMTKQQIKDMKKIRKKRDSAQQGIKGKYTKRNKKTPAPKKCSSCGIKETPEWRKGPEGPRTLCNACGLHYAKLMKNRETNEGKWIGTGTQPTIDIVTLRQATGVGIQPQLNERGEVEIPGVLINIPRANLLKEPLRIGAKPPPPPLPFQRLSFTNPANPANADEATSTSTPTAGNVSSNTPTTSQTDGQTQTQGAGEANVIEPAGAAGPAGDSQKSTEMMDATPTLGPALAESSQQTPPSSHMDLDHTQPAELSATPGTVEPPMSSPSVSSRKRKAVSDDDEDETMGNVGEAARGEDTGKPVSRKRRKTSPQASHSHTISDVSEAPPSPTGNESHRSGTTTPTQTQTSMAMAHSPAPPPPLTPTISMASMASDTTLGDRYTQ